MSTSRDSHAALHYSGTNAQPGSILQLAFDIGSRGADVRWVSQFPAEQELLYPPCTSLTCSQVLKVGAKRVLQVTASVSTHRPDVSWCKTPFDTPPRNRPKQPESLGPFALKMLDVDAYSCELRSVDKTRSTASRWRDALAHSSSHARRMSVLRKEEDEANVWTIQGMNLSPIQEVSLRVEEREQASIPAEATHYAFAYPLDDEDALTQIEHIVEPTLRSLTTVGGFVYFRADYLPEGHHDQGVRQMDLELLKVNVLAKSDGRGLIFDGPFSFGTHSVDGALVQRAPIAERHAVTLPDLAKCGIQHFSWMPAVGPHGEPTIRIV